MSLDIFGNPVLMAQLYESSTFKLIDQALIIDKIHFRFKALVPKIAGTPVKRHLPLTLTLEVDKSKDYSDKMKQAKENFDTAKDLLGLRKSVNPV